MLTHWSCIFLALNHRYDICVTLPKWVNLKDLMITFCDKLEPLKDAWQPFWPPVMAKQCDILHDDIIKWNHFPHYWPFVRQIHWSPVNSPHKGQWHGALMFSLICAWINGWVNNHEAGDLRRHHTHYDITVMFHYSVYSFHLEWLPRAWIQSTTNTFLYFRCKCLVFTSV